MKEQTRVGEFAVKPELSRWDPVKLTIEVIGSNEEHTFVGWRAALMMELTRHRASMTLEGAVSFLTLNHSFHLEPREVSEFLRDMVDKGLVKNRSEKGVKTGAKRRVFSSQHGLKDFVSLLEIVEAA